MDVKIIIISHFTTTPYPFLEANFIFASDLIPSLINQKESDIMMMIMMLTKPM